MKIQAKHLHVVHEFPITDTLSDILPILTKVQCTILFLSSGLLGDFPQHTQNTTIPLFCPQRSKPISPTEICIQSLKLWNSVNVLQSLTAAAPVCCTDTTTIMLQFNINEITRGFLRGRLSTIFCYPLITAISTLIVLTNHFHMCLVEYYKSRLNVGKRTGCIGYDI